MTCGQPLRPVVSPLELEVPLMQVLEEVLERVEWAPAHARAKGEFRCAACGYGVVVAKTLPSCPMCREHVWERIAWRPFSERTLV